MLQRSPSTPSPHLFCRTLDGLASVLAPGVNLALWQRSSVAAVEEELLALDASALPDVRCATSPDTVYADCSALMERQGIDPGAFTNWISDITRLTDIFCRLAPDRQITLRLETLADDGCTRFHVDHTYLRLLCTYRGPGTEWLENTQVNRSALGCGRNNEDIITAGSAQRFQPFWVGVMKGAGFPGEGNNALVHRSPPLAGSRLTRVLLCLDASHNDV